MTFLSSFNKRAAQVYGSILAVVFLAITFVLTGNVITRYFFGYSVFWAEELTNYIIIWITFLGMALCVRKGMHVSIDLILQYVKKGYARAFLIGFGIVASLVFSLFITIVGWQQVVDVYKTGQITPALQIPMFIPYLSLPVGGLLTTLELLQELLNLFQDKSSWQGEDETKCLDPL